MSDEGKTSDGATQAWGRHSEVVRDLAKGVGSDPDGETSDLATSLDATRRPEPPPDPGVTCPSTDVTTVPHPGRSSSPGSAPEAGIGIANPPGYVIERELGRGGMGVVYLARQVRANRLVAIKMVLAGRERQDDIQRFLNEGESLARLHHPNIVQLFEVGIFEGRPFFSMEYARGGSFADAIARATPSPAEAAALAETLARAIHAAHQCGVVHRDLKPANVLIAGGPGDGPSPRGVPKITDFGLAKQVGSDSGLTQTGQVMGTPSYMAPEQATGGANVGVPADVYALGAILYELLAGRPPFRAGSVWETMSLVVNEPPTPPSRWRRGIPRDLEVIVLKCLAKAPADRYASADALAEDLKRFLAGESILARPAGASRRLWLWSRRRPAIAALLAALLATAVAGAVGVVVQWRRAEANLDAADARLALAMEATERYYVGAGGDILLKQPGLAELRKTLLHAPLEFYRKLADDLESGGRDDPRSRAALGRSVLALARVTTDVGTTDEAVAAYRHAIAVGERMAGAHPRDPEGLRIAVAGRVKMASVLIEARRLKEARAVLEAALAAADRCAREFPGDLGDADDRASCLHGLADIHSVEEAFEKSEAEFLRAIAIREGILAEHPDRHAVLDNLASTRNELGRLYNRSGHIEKAIQAIRGSIADRRRLCGQRPADVGYRRRLSSSLNNAGASLIDMARPGEAIACYTEALSIQEEIAREHPAVSLYQRDLAASLINTSRCRRSLNEGDLADRLMNRALAILRPIIERDPENVIYRSTYYDAKFQQVYNAIDADRMEEAAPMMEELVALSKDLVARDGSALRLTFLADDERRLGLVRANLGRTAEGRDSMAACVETLTRLAAAHPDDVEVTLNLASARWGLANLDSRRGQATAAESLFRESLAAHPKLLAAQPSDWHFADDAATAHRVYGEHLVRQAEVTPGAARDERARRALDELGRAVEITRRFLEAEPGNQSVKQSHAQALAAHARALSAFAPAEAAAPLAEWDRALALVAAQGRQEIILGRAETLARAGRAEEAIRAVGSLRPSTMWGQVALARVYAQAGKPRAGRAIEALRAALTHPRSGDGVLVLAATAEPAFASLATRPDFVALQNELRDRTFPSDPFARP